MLAGVVFAGLVARALTRLGLRTSECSASKHFNQRVCGASPSLLDDLLAPLFLVLGTVSLIEFARACQTVEGEVSSGVRYFVRLGA